MINPLGYARSLFCFAGLLAACLFVASSGGAADDKKDDKKADKAPRKHKKPRKCRGPLQGVAALFTRLFQSSWRPDALGQPPQMPPNSEKTPNMRKASRCHRSQYRSPEAAQEFAGEAAKNDSWGEAAGCCSKCSMKEDIFIPVSADRPTVLRRSIRSPRPGKSAARTMRQGPRVLCTFRRGRKPSGQGQEEGGWGLKEVARCYYTAAGIEATDLLRHHYLDRVGTTRRLASNCSNN